MSASVSGPGTGVLVTGGASGLGRATAIALAEWERPVAVWDVQGEAASAAAKECSERFGVVAHAQEVDLRDGRGFEAALAETRAAMPSIGGFAHCAGVTRAGPFGSIDMDDWDLQIDVNLRAFVVLGQLLLPDLQTAGRGASIVGVASTQGLRGFPLIPGYCASKHGLVGTIRSMAQSLGPLGIRANAVCPGAMDTPMLAQSLEAAGEGMAEQMKQMIPLGYISDPAEVARVIRFLLSDDAAYVTGTALPVDGGMLA